MIRIENLHIDLGKFCLSLKSFQLHKEECQVVIGPTGSGKTLLLESVLGLRKEINGSIYLDGRSSEELPINKRKVGYVPQDLALFPNLNVKENIYFGLKFNNKKTDDEFVLKLCRLLQIEHLQDRRINRLSGGEKQRVALARALAPGHKILLLDEPFSALHEGLRKQLWFELKEIQKEFKLSILLVTHDIEEAFYMGDKMSILIGGNLHQTGDKEEIYYYPKSKEVADFMGVKNLFEVDFVRNDEQFLYYFFPELEKEFRIPVRAKFHCNKLINKCIAGIRAIEVMVLNPNLPIKYNDNLLEGNIKRVFNKGAMHTLIFQTTPTKKEIEIEMPNHAYKKLNIHEGMFTKIFLKANSLFLIPASD